MRETGNGRDRDRRKKHKRTVGIKAPILTTLVTARWHQTPHWKLEQQKLLPNAFHDHIGQTVRMLQYAYYILAVNSLNETTTRCNIPELMKGNDLNATAENQRGQVGLAPPPHVAQGRLRFGLRAQAAVLVRRPHLPRDARRRPQDDAQPDLPLDQGQLRLLQDRRQELAGKRLFIRPSLRPPDLTLAWS